jgi:hypothetical protein
MKTAQAGTGQRAWRTNSFEPGKPKCPSGQTAKQAESARLKETAEAQFKGARSGWDDKFDLQAGYARFGQVLDEPWVARRMLDSTAYRCGC